MVVESTEGLTASQRDRRLRVIRAALELAAHGGYEAVQMRDVSTEAGVALGTIYRYFSSKDHLLVAAMLEWMLDLERTVTRRPPEGDTSCDRVLDVLHRALRSVERDPALAAAVVTAQTSDDGAAARATQEVTEVMYRIMGAAFPTIPIPVTPTTSSASSVTSGSRAWCRGPRAWATSSGCAARWTPPPTSSCPPPEPVLVPRFSVDERPSWGQNRGAGSDHLGVRGQIWARPSQ